jgi:hypothetical protein
MLSVAILGGPAAGSAAAEPAADYGARVKCRYVITEPSSEIGWTEARLAKLVVSPPNVLAQSGTQTVGWRFIVKRSLSWDEGPWKITYRSPIQRASATTSSAAAFSKMKVDVTVPNVENQSHVYYEVILKVFWYGADGSVQSTAQHEFDQYAQVVGHTQWDYDMVCPGLVTQAV